MHRLLARTIASVGLALPVAFDAESGTLSGRFGLEMEYLGESYFAEQTLSLIDAPVGSARFIDTTRFADDRLLPGPRLDLVWSLAPGTRTRVDLFSRSAYNRDRFTQELAVEMTVPGAGRGSWWTRVAGSFRDEERSLVGYGDWNVRADVRRRTALGNSLDGQIQVGVEHSRSRGDSLTYLYDFDLVRARASLTHAGGWLPRWETFLEGTIKTVPGRSEPGAYGEVRGGAQWRPGSAGTHAVVLEGRWRDYRVDDTVGRDVRTARAEYRGRVLPLGGSRVDLELQGDVADYRSEDELYYDAARVHVHAPWRWQPGDWSVSAGPAAEWLWELGEATRDYRQVTGRVSAGRLTPGGGFAELTVDSGVRDYRRESSDVFQVGTLSTSLLRTDYVLLDVLALANWPLWGYVTLDVVGNASWEFHDVDSERIQVTVLTVGVSRAF